MPQCQSSTLSVGLLKTFANSRLVIECLSLKHKKCERCSVALYFKRSLDIPHSCLISSLQSLGQAEKMVRKQIKLIQLSRAGQLHLFRVGFRLGRKSNAQCVSTNYQRVLTSSVHALKLLPSALIVFLFCRKKYEVHLPTSTTGTVLRQAPDLLMLTERNRSLKAGELVLLLAIRFKPSPNSPCLCDLSW